MGHILAGGTPTAMTFAPVTYVSRSKEGRIMPNPNQGHHASTVLAHQSKPLTAAWPVSHFTMGALDRLTMGLHPSPWLTGLLRSLFGVRGLRHADLKGADLERADLAETNLTRADLRSANLRGANLWQANLRGADLRRADLATADLLNAKLRSADLLGADLGGADLRGADLTQAYLKYAAYDKRTLWPEGFDPVAAGAILAE